MPLLALITLDVNWRMHELIQAHMPHTVLLAHDAAPQSSAFFACMRVLWDDKGSEEVSIYCLAGKYHSAVLHIRYGALTDKTDQGMLP